MAGDYHEGQLSEAMTEPVLGRRRGRLGSGSARIGRPCALVSTGPCQAAADEFEAAAFPSAYHDANTPRDERERINGRLRHGQVKVICNIATMTTGVDLDVRCIILARPTKSEILFVQIIGRGLRTADRQGRLPDPRSQRHDTSPRLRQRHSPRAARHGDAPGEQEPSQGEACPAP